MGKLNFNLFVMLMFLMYCFACGLGKTEYEYPDGIEEPESIIESRGCGDFFVYQFLDSKKVLTVQVDGNNLDLTKKSQKIILGTGNPDVSVHLEVAGDSPDSVYFFHCDDAIPMNLAEPTKYFPTSGTLTYSVSEDYPETGFYGNSYSVTVKVEDLHLYNAKSNDEIIIDEVVFWNVLVGWLPG